MNGECGAVNGERGAAVAERARGAGKMRAMDRRTRALIAIVGMGLWLGYMVVGLSVINTLLPTQHGEGPEGAAAFMGLIGGVVGIGLVMWAASD